MSDATTMTNIPSQRPDAGTQAQNATTTTVAKVDQKSDGSCHITPTTTNGQQAPTQQQQIVDTPTGGQSTNPTPANVQAGYAEAKAAVQ